MGELARRAKASEVELADMAVTPAQVAELQGLVDSGRLTDSMARQVLDGVLAGEGDPAARSPRRAGSRSSPTTVPSTRRSTGRWRPTPTWSTRSGPARCRRPGAIIGAVMKEMRGQADAARVRELVLERAAG